MSFRQSEALGEIIVNQRTLSLILSDYVLRQ